MKTYILRDPKAVQPQNRKPNPRFNPLPASVSLPLWDSTELRRCGIIGGQHDDMLTTNGHQCTRMVVKIGSPCTDASRNVWCLKFIGTVTTKPPSLLVFIRVHSWFKGIPSA